MSTFTLPTDEEQAAISSFARFCESTRAVELDPSNQLDWYSMTVGFLLALLPNHSADRLIDVAIYVRHKLGIG